MSESPHSISPFEEPVRGLLKPLREATDQAPTSDLAARHLTAMLQLGDELALQRATTATPKTPAAPKPITWYTILTSMGATAAACTVVAIAMVGNPFSIDNPSPANPPIVEPAVPAEDSTTTTTQSAARSANRPARTSRRTRIAKDKPSAATTTQPADNAAAGSGSGSPSTSSDAPSHHSHPSTTRPNTPRPPATRPGGGPNNMLGGGATGGAACPGTAAPGADEPTPLAPPLPEGVNNGQLNQPLAGAGEVNAAPPAMCGGAG